MSDASTKQYAGLLSRASCISQVYYPELVMLTPNGEGSEFVLDDAQRHHMAKVLRVRDGQKLAVTDGRGAWSVGAVVQSDAGRIALTTAVKREEQKSSPCTLAFSLPKRENAELIVQKLTEVGVDTIQPLVTERTVVRWDEAKRQARTRRFREIAREAAMQSRRVWLPEVRDICSLEQLVSSSEAPIYLAHPGGGSIPVECNCIIVGPEGGWSDQELALGAGRVGLGGTVLRAETAAIVAGFMLMQVREVQ